MKSFLTAFSSYCIQQQLLHEIKETEIKLIRIKTQLGGKTSKTTKPLSIRTWNYVTYLYKLQEILKISVYDINVYCLYCHTSSFLNFLILLPSLYLPKNPPINQPWLSMICFSSNLANMSTNLERHMQIQGNKPSVFCVTIKEFI